MFTTNMLLGVTAVTFSAAMMPPTRLRRRLSKSVVPEKKSADADVGPGWKDVDADAPPDVDADHIPLGWAQVFHEPKREVTKEDKWYLHWPSCKPSRPFYFGIKADKDYLALDVWTKVEGFKRKMYFPLISSNFAQSQRITFGNISDSKVYASISVRNTTRSGIQTQSWISNRYSWCYDLYFPDVEQAKIFMGRLKEAKQMHGKFFDGEFKDVLADRPEVGEKCEIPGPGYESMYLGWAQEKIKNGLIVPYYFKAVSNGETFSLIHWNRYTDGPELNTEMTEISCTYRYDNVKKGEYPTIQLKGRNKEGDVTKELIFKDEKQAQRFTMQLQGVWGKWSKFFTERPKDVQQPIADCPGQFLFQPSSPNNLGAGNNSGK